MSLYGSWAEWNAISIRLLRKRNAAEKELREAKTIAETKRAQAKLDGAKASILAHEAHYIPSRSARVWGR